MMRKHFCNQTSQPRFKSQLLGLFGLMILVTIGCSDQKKQARTLLEQAVSRQREESHEDAIRLLDRAIALDADLGEAVFARGVSEMHLENYDTAVIHIRQALKNKSDWPQAWWTLATVLRLQDRDEEALDALSRAIRLNPRFKEARFDRACLHQYAGRTVAALADLDQVLQYTPDHKDALLHRGRLRRQTDDSPAASRDLGELIRLNRKCADAWFERAKTSEADADLERALADATVACRLAADREEFRALRAALLSGLGRNQEAAEDFCRLARLQSSPSKAMLQAARAYESSGNAKQAMICLEPVLMDEQSEAEALAVRARLRQQTGDSVGELADIERAWALSQGDPLLGECLARCRIKAGRLDQALTLITELLQGSDTDQVELVELRAGIFTRLERHDEAIRDYTKLTSFG